MARPLKQGLSYFPHDTDAHNDIKVQSLMALYGTEGYAFYFILLEKVFHTENGRIICGSEAIKAGLAKSIGISKEKFDVILLTALEIGCFDADIYTEERALTSNGIAKRVASISTLRLKDRNRKDKDKRKGKGKAKTGKPTENPDTPLNTRVQDLENKQNNDNFGKTKASSRTPVSDKDFIQALKTNPAYKGVDIDKELSKMDAWFLTPKGRGRQKTHRFILNWLNKAEREMPQTAVGRPGQIPCRDCKDTKYTMQMDGYCRKCAEVRGKF